MVSLSTLKDDIMKVGFLAKQYCGKTLPLQVMQSQAGFYIGTANEDGLPCSRESNGYFSTREKAQKALDSGEWSQKESP
jgi:hypothetical protein